MYDIIIIGAGPAGLTAALYARRANKKVLVLEAKSYGGQIINANKVENYPGIANISGFDLATNMYNQVKEIGAEIKFETALHIDKDKNVTTNEGTYQAKSIILATGAENRKLNIPKEEDFIGKGISYCATCDGNFYKNKIVAVVGGGNTALEDAIYLSDIAKKRLNVIKDFTELGSGFSIAMRDLSIRGAGDILGKEQAGFIDSVGVELFMNMLNAEVNKLKGIETVEDTKANPLIDVETTIDDNYVSDEELKIEIHQKINSIDSIKKLKQVKAELEDRFGKINETIEIYMYEQLLEKSLLNIGIDNIVQTKTSVSVYIPDKLVKKLNTDELFMDVCSISRNFRFSMKLTNLVITLDIVNLDKHFIYYLLDLVDILEKSLNNK